LGIYCSFCCNCIDRIGNGRVSFGKIGIDESSEKFENGVDQNQDLPDSKGL
jgi:hypothetical protein